jgi:hypothetical protein
MFVLPPESRATGSVTVEVDGRPVTVPEGSSAAFAALCAASGATRTSPATGEPRAPYCMMGVCFECLLEIDGLPSQQGCMVAVRPGMTIRRPQGAREVR